MKKLLFILLSALSLTAFSQQKKVAVYVMGEDEGVNKVLGSKLVSAIARSEEYSAIERTAAFLAELNKEQNYQRTGAVDDDDISRLGKQFGVQYVCVAAVTEAFNEKYLSARLINVESAQVERSASSSGAIQSMESLVNAANNVSDNLLVNLGKGKQSNSPKVAVYVVKNDAGKGVGRVLGDKLVAGFANSGRYIAIERTNSFLFQLSREQNYQQSGAVDDSDLSRLGKQFGVQYVCVVEVSDVFGEKYVSARLIDVETAEVLNSYDIGGDLKSMRSCLKIAHEISDALSQVTIAELKKEQRRINQEGYVDLGLPSGTCWKKINQNGKMTYDEAIKVYYEYLPNQNQYTELTENCQFVKYGNNVRVVGPNGNYFELEQNTKDAWFLSSYLSKTTYEGNGVYSLITYEEDQYTAGSIAVLSIFDPIGVILCQQVDAFQKRQHDDRTLTTRKEYIPVFSQKGEFYCDGSYEKDDGKTFQSPYLKSLDKDYFRISFEFMALSYEGITNNKYSDDKQYPIVLSDYHRSMGLCLHNDGTISIETNNGDHSYETNQKYIPNKYCNIDIEYYKGWLTINGQKIWVDMQIDDELDKQIYSINYSSGNSFKGFLKDVKVYNVRNIDD